jgi:hypothetical protein
MIRRLLPLLAVAAVLAPAGAATAASGRATAGPPVGSRGETIATTEPSAARPAATSPTPSGPVLALSASKPLVVRGSRFARAELVRVSYRAAEHSSTRSVRTTLAGGFALTAPQTLVYDPCSTTLVVFAKGTTGDTATLKRPPRGCAPG